MPVFLIALLATTMLVVISVTVVMARRLDRLHQTVVKSRRALELALRARAEYARAYALSGSMDFAAAIVLTDAAEACISAGMQPIINDGLDRVDIVTSTNGVSDRRNLESALSRALRLTVDDNFEERPEETEHGQRNDVGNEGDSSGAGSFNAEHVPGSDFYGSEPFRGDETAGGQSEKSEKLELLERSRLDVRLTRTFHNSHVDQIRRLRRSAWVRLFHLAGSAPMPITVDIDDE